MHVRCKSLGTIWHHPTWRITDKVFFWSRKPPSVGCTPWNNWCFEEVPNELWSFKCSIGEWFTNRNCQSMWTGLPMLYCCREFKTEAELKFVLVVSYKICILMCNPQKISAYSKSFFGVSLLKSSVQGGCVEPLELAVEPRHHRHPSWHSGWVTKWRVARCRKCRNHGGWRW